MDDYMGTKCTWCDPSKICKEIVYETGNAFPITFMVGLDAS